jgi:hypothetical protein
MKPVHWRIQLQSIELGRHDDATTTVVFRALIDGVEFVCSEDRVRNENLLDELSFICETAVRSFRRAAMKRDGLL